MRAKPLIERLVETLREVQTKTHCHPLLRVKIEAISVTLSEIEARKVVYTWANTGSRVEIRTVDVTLGQLEAKALINTPSDALA